MLDKVDRGYRNRNTGDYRILPLDLMQVGNSIAKHGLII